MTANKTITAIIVTFNRRSELERCINAVLNQSQHVDNILVIDNNSSDSTLEYLKDTFLSGKNAEKNKLYSCKAPNQTNVYIFSNKKNTGGSGGFHTGMKIAYEKIKTDLYWMMDDDGYPSENCLEKLYPYTDKYDYIMPTSIDIDDHAKLSWPVAKKDKIKTISYQELKNSWGKIMNYVTPFNGILLTNECIKKVGYINENFFIWGDEYDHYWRCMEKKIQPVTLMEAEFYHPSQKLPLVPICFGLFKVPYVDSNMRMVCLARNYTYIYRHYHQKYKIPVKFLMYSWLYIFTRHGDFEGWKLYIDSVKDGFKEDFTRHKLYL